MKYKGSCHCRSVRFEFECEEMVSALQCNCSICIRKNALMSKQSIEPEKFTLVQGKENLSVYHWGDKDVNHYFCKTCGIYPFHDSIYEPGKYRVNLGCIENLEPRTLPVSQFDGKNQL
ncbi:GFA family protein [Thalassomonas viridans]|uniref:GFA family protein n=1 Tax=Thalassomonas viridans TaxID=137584 RepID=A0AAF0C7A9_9GAMM|nr:GFA family protein [Thalassomonas viridans]WDE03151.1 GFA family protein [Thalassomonas viridans]